MNDCVDGFASASELPAGCQTRLGLLLARVGSTLLDGADAGLAPAGLNGREYSVLAVLSDDEPRSQLELAQMLGKAPALMVAVIDGLESRGLVERTRDASDRRRTRVTLTAAGQKALRHGDELADAMVAALLGGLESREREQLHALLRSAVAPGAPAAA